MHAYSEVYLDDVVENQGKLFDLVAQSFRDKDTVDFIQTYMTSKTRKSIDEAKAYVNTMDAGELWKYFSVNEGYTLKSGKALDGFMPDWIGKKSWSISLMKAYYGLHDLELELTVKRLVKYNADYLFS